MAVVVSRMYQVVLQWGSNGGLGDRDEYHVMIVGP